MKVKKNVLDLVRPNIKGLLQYSSARDEFKIKTNEMTFLDANENPFDNGINRYPDPQQIELKNVLSKIKGVSQENMLIGNGSDEVLDLIFRAFCEPGKENVITLPPTYGMYKVLADINNVENLEVLLNNDFEPNVDEILKKQNNSTKLLFVCSPNNPTGNTFKEDYILKLLENFNGMVVIDEAYIDFSDKESWLLRLNDFSNLIIIQTLSKAYGMAGIRLGICYASKNIIAILNKIKPPYNINILSQTYAVQHLEKTNNLKNEISYINEEKNTILKALINIKYILKVYESDTNFILIKVDEASMRYDQLVACGIVLRNRSSLPLCENTLRITIGTPLENKLLINALKSMDI